MKSLFKQIIKFGIVGVIAFVIDYSLLYILTEFCGIHYLVSSIISFIISLAFNYWASIKWVFNARKQSIRDVIIFVLFSVFGLVLNSLIMYIMVEKMKVYYMITKIVATFVVMIFNFITRKIFIEGNRN